MDTLSRIETTLEDALGGMSGGPPRLADAIRHAVFPGGMRVRPRLCIAVADACGASHAASVDGAAAAIELMHCASLVHDDLPCFDDAAFRRGVPSVHRMFGAPLAVLAGDALIVLAFETLASAGAGHPRLAEMIGKLARASGMPAGLVAGQAWECEPARSLGAYHRAKTASLFALAAEAGAIAAGGDAASWRKVGEALGEAYQIADDLRDGTLSAAELGKPAGRDALLGRPSAASELGTAPALELLGNLVRQAIGRIPSCPRPAGLRHLIEAEMRRLLPAGSPLDEASRVAA